MTLLTLRDLLGGVLISAATVVTAFAAERPNVLWISAEDLSASTLGCYGGAATRPGSTGWPPRGSGSMPHFQPPPSAPPREVASSAA